MGEILVLLLRLHECRGGWLMWAAGGALALAGYPLLRRFRMQSRRSGGLYVARRCVSRWGPPLCFIGFGLFLVLFSQEGGQSDATVTEDEADTRCEGPEKNGVMLADPCRTVKHRGGGLTEEQGH
ncbi:hypothetical protein [Enterobacter kobei]